MKIFVKFFCYKWEVEIIQGSKCFRKIIKSKLRITGNGKGQPAAKAATSPKTAPMKAAKAAPKKPAKPAPMKAAPKTAVMKAMKP